MVTYSFITSFTIQSSIYPVWDSLIDFKDWPEWWRGVRNISVGSTDNPHVLQVGLGYWFYILNLEFTLKEIREYERIELFSKGDLEGIGKFTLLASDTQTTVTFYWDVVTTKKWMNLTAPVLRPLFEFSHNLVMKWFVRGLAKKLDSKILTEKYLTNK